MDKGFNDDELADIMNEIESLEKEFSADSESPEPTASESPISEAEAEEMMMADMESEQDLTHEVEAPTAEQSHEVPVAEVDSEDSVTEVVEHEAPVAEVTHEEPVMETHHETPVSETEESFETVAEHQEEDATVPHEEHSDSNVVSFEAPAAAAPEETEVLEDLTAMDVEKVTAHHTKEDNGNVHSITPKATSHTTSHTGSGHHTSMNFSVEGDMKLNLNFNISGKVVSLHIAEDHFSIELDGGMSFNIPFDHAEDSKKAA